MMCEGVLRSERNAAGATTEEEALRLAAAWEANVVEREGGSPGTKSPSSDAATALEPLAPEPCRCSCCCSCCSGEASEPPGEVSANEVPRVRRRVLGNRGRRPLSQLRRLPAMLPPPVEGCRVTGGGLLLLGELLDMLLPASLLGILVPLPPDPARRSTPERSERAREEEEEVGDPRVGCGGCWPRCRRPVLPFLMLLLRRRGLPPAERVEASRTKPEEDGTLSLESSRIREQPECFVSCRVAAR